MYFQLPELHLIFLWSYKEMTLKEHLYMVTECPLIVQYHPLEETFKNQIWNFVCWYLISALCGMRGLIRKWRPISRKKVCWGRSEWHSCFCLFSQSFRLKYLICQGAIFGGSLSWSPSRASERKRKEEGKKKKEKAGRKEGKEKVGKHLLSNPAPKLGVIKIY